MIHAFAFGPFSQSPYSIHITLNHTGPYSRTNVFHCLEKNLNLSDKLIPSRSTSRESQTPYSRRFDFCLGPFILTCFILRTVDTDCNYGV